MRHVDLGANMKAAARVAGSVLALAAVLVGPVHAQISVSPIDFSLHPTGPRVSSFSVTNDTQDPQQLTFVTNDWDRDVDGGNRFTDLGTLPSSCKSRIQVFPQSVRLGPNASQSIRVSLAESDTSSAPCWTIVFAQTAPAPTGRGSKVAFVVRIGVKVYVTAADAIRDATIDSMGVAPHLLDAKSGKVDSTTHDVVAMLHNTGGTQIQVKGTVEFRTLDNRTVATDTVSDTPVLPGALRRIRVQVPATLKAGTYVALAIFGFGGTDDVAAQAEVTVP
ncbi:MAG TPA: hypothetical protein VGR60_06355 [Gemmatimonadales bacterium]|nr:hypothetical protein [Gemmatimonadales bacterium]